MSDMPDKRLYLAACRRLPFSVDAVRLQAEVSALPAEAWSNPRAPVHQETVSVFLKGHPPLAGISGDPDQPLLGRCPYVRELLYGLLPGTPGKCLLAALRPQGLVYPHTDAANDYFLRSFRIHLPVFTNAQVRFFCGRRFFRMLPGEVWTVNNLAPHAVVNDHPSETRVHLIFDVFPLPETVELVARTPEAPGEEDTALFERIARRRPVQAGI